MNQDTSSLPIGTIIKPLLPKDAQPQDKFELCITFEEAGLNVRETAGYLEFIDRVYGRLVSDGLRSYAQRPDQQIKVTTFRSGSLDMIFQELVANADKVSATIILGLLLKYLPAAIESLAAAFKDYEEAQLTRLRREKLLKQMQENEQLNSLGSGGLDELAGYLDSVYQAEFRSLPAAGRFAEKYVKLISFGLARQKND